MRHSRQCTGLDTALHLQSFAHPLRSNLTRPSVSFQQWTGIPNKQPKRGSQDCSHLAALPMFGNPSVIIISRVFSHSYLPIMCCRLKNAITSSAHICFTSLPVVHDFAAKFQGRLFATKRGLHMKCLVIYAPYQRVPRQKPRQDPRENSLQKGVTTQHL